MSRLAVSKCPALATFVSVIDIFVSKKIKNPASEEKMAVQCMFRRAGMNSIGGGDGQEGTTFSRSEWTLIYTGWV